MRQATNITSALVLLRVSLHALIISFMFGLSVQAQQITQSVIAGGGGKSAAETRQVEGTIGQSVVGTSSGGGFKVEGGFWTGGPIATASAVSVDDVSGVFGGTVTLKATLLTSGAGLNGKLISFTLNGTALGTATTGNDGVATLSNISLSGINVGVYPGAVTAQFAGEAELSASNGSGQLTVEKANQIITFAALGNQTFGAAPFTVSATATSGMAVTFSIESGQGSLVGNTVTINTAGTIVVRASQAGDENYNAATPVDQSFEVLKATSTVTLSNLSHTHDGSAKSATATTNPAGKTVNITYSQGGNSVAAPTNVGSYDVTATINETNFEGSTTGVLTITSDTCIAPPANLLAWWPGDNNPRDIAGGHDGVLQGGASFAAGEVLQAFSLNGSSAVVQVPDSPEWDLGASPFTIDLWVNFTQVNATNALVAHTDGSGNANKWVFQLNNGSLDFHTNDTLGNAATVGVPFSPVPGDWYHVAVKRSGASYTFFINGSPSTPITSAATVPDAAAPLTIGSAAVGNFVNGLIDEVEIFDRALSDTEVRDIFAYGTAGKCKPADLRITKTHSGNFTQGDLARTYIISVINEGPGATDGVITVSDALPAGLNPVSIGGSGWNCLQPAGPCHRNDPLSSSASYPAITLTVNVANDALPLITNTASVSGGGELDTTDNTASDPTSINSPAPTPSISATGSTLVSESCPAFNGALDPGERVTVTLRLMNNGTGSTSDLVATLLSTGGVIAPTGPTNYGSVSPGQTVGRDFTLTIDPALLCGGTLTATLQLQDGTINLGTVSFNFTLGVNNSGAYVCTAPCGGYKLTVTSNLVRLNATTVQANISVQNTGTLPANNTVLTTAKLGTLSLTPQSLLGNLAPGATANVSVIFSNAPGPATSSNLVLSGSFTGGTFTNTKRVTVP